MNTEAEKTEIIPTSLNNFNFQRIINNSEDRNSFICLCTTEIHGSKENAIVFLKKASFKEENIPLFFSGKEGVEGDSPILPASLTKLLQHNDKFFNFISSCDSRLNQLFINIICPASEKDIEKYSAVPYFVVRETPSIYEKITFPYILSRMTEKELKWVFNILDGKAEADRIIYDSAKDENSNLNTIQTVSRYSLTSSTTGVPSANISKSPSFILAPDTKWDEQVMESLYVLGILRHPIIPCLRCLSVEDLPVLREIRSRGLAEIVRKYGSHGVTPDRILAYVHYLPSFFQFHVHFVSTGRSDFHAPRCYLLDDIIDRLEEDALSAQSGPPTAGASSFSSTLSPPFGDARGFYAQTSLSAVLIETHPVLASLRSLQTPPPFKL